MKHISLSLVIALAALGGCNRQLKDLPYDQLDGNDIVARVGSATYTKAELERDVAITEKLSALAGFAPQEMASRQNPSKFRQQVANGFVGRELLLQEAARRKIDLLPDDMQAFQAEFAAGISSRMPMTFKGLLDALGPEATQFRNNLKKDALSARIEQILRQEFLAAQPAVSASDAEAKRREALAFNRKVEETNRSLMRLATNSWRSIRAGNDFATVGRKLAEMRQEITFDAAYADPAGRHAKTPPNLTLPPTAAEDGVEVVKVVQAPDGARTIGRIFFRPKTPRDVPTEQTASEAVRQDAANVAYSNWIKSRRAAADVQVVGFTD